MLDAGENKVISYVDEELSISKGDEEDLPDEYIK